jgi:DNA-binding HxlR family transcriptional regulator
MPNGERDVPQTAVGEESAPRTHRAWSPLARALAATGDHWTLMIVLQLAPGRTRLSRLKRALPGVSTGVLERYVQQMVALGLLTRTRFKEMPPRVELELTSQGRELLPVAGALARWGMRHMWSVPGEREQVGVDALLRVLPVLLEEDTGLPEGFLEMIVTHNGQPPDSFVYRLQHGRLSLENRAKDPPISGVEGDRDAWIAALGPTADYTRLRFSGDAQLARRILDALPGRE